MCKRPAHLFKIGLRLLSGLRLSRQQCLHTFQLNFWYAHLLTDNVALSVRLENLWKSNYHGADPETNDVLISTNVESFRGGYSLNLGLGVAALINGHLFNTEFVPTLYQDLDGIQLETDWTFVTSWSKSF